MRVEIQTNKNMLKKKTENELDIKDVAKEASQKLLDFLTLCREIYVRKLENINKLEEASPFYQTARDIAEEFEMDWDNLSAEDSDELLLALQEDYYNRIQIAPGYSYTAQVSVKKLEKD